MLNVIMLSDAECRGATGRIVRLDRGGLVWLNWAMEGFAVLSLIMTCSASLCCAGLSCIELG
jgi:hypothetical protein